VDSITEIRNELQEALLSCEPESLKLMQGQIRGLNEVLEVIRSETRQ